MKKRNTTFFLIFYSFATFACTTFVIKDSTQLVFGRNLDWVSDNGVVVINKRNVEKTSLVFPPEKPITWTSKYGSVTFNQFGKEFTFGGINEKGLVVEIMLVDGNYPKLDDRQAVNELQWVQYQLDNSKTIEDVVSTDAFLRISKINQNLHFLICDSVGNAAVIEFINNKMVVYKGDNLPVPVLENDTYAKSLNKNEVNETCRFSMASKMIQQYSNYDKKPIIDYSFSILNKVALSGSWSIVYDIKNMQIHFKTSSNKIIRKIDILKFDFDCKEESLLYDLRRKDNNQINSYFIPYSAELNTNKMKAGIKSNDIQFSKVLLDKFLVYAETCKCVYE